ncbi:hypothetical protein U9M48_020662 [Paspalum notatum var. saurae]|uniref:Uncharacterized protein n=1 Tax=Paspalum notatum var. saurae TaxID=547442 RepID=A0AAQ3TFD4_PASNO
MAQRLCKGKPKARRLWALVRRLLLRKGHRPPPEDAEGEKSGLLGRSSLEQLLVTDAGDGAPGDGDGDGDGDVCRCAKKHAQPVAVLLPALDRAEAAATIEVFGSELSGAGRGGGVLGHRRFAFGGFRRRLLMRRPWRPMLVAIPE